MHILAQGWCEKESGDIRLISRPLGRGGGRDGACASEDSIVPSRAVYLATRVHTCNRLALRQVDGVFTLTTDL